MEAGARGSGRGDCVRFWLSGIFSVFSNETAPLALPEDTSTALFTLRACMRALHPSMPMFFIDGTLIGKFHHWGPGSQGIIKRSRQDLRSVC